jgi:hypothetical protein
LALLGASASAAVVALRRGIERCRLNTADPNWNLSHYTPGALTDGEFVLYRGANWSRPDSTSVVLLARAFMQPAPGTTKKMEYEYSLRIELNSAWAVRALKRADPIVRREGSKRVLMQSAAATKQEGVE